ncbi:hypothetical protein MRB53_029412 [Persea americana]|uniref:Uncharacterized protein n=1 Tax=Persea americana TaxID=3435 RepID=A0ACC2KIP1_PERAE|nr:hypothetical protein MRB53_029412 [Persea americana]
MSSWRSFSHLSNFHLPTEKTQPKTLARFIFPSPYLIHLSLLPLQINSSVLQFQIKICFIYRFLGLESDCLNFEFEAHPLVVKTTKYVFVLLWRGGGILAGFFEQLLHCRSF